MAGVTWPEPTPRTTSQQPSDDEESSFWDEGEGSEEETDDEEVEIENEGWINYWFGTQCFFDSIGPYNIISL